MNFTPWPVNRTTFPSRFILVCEDDAEWQSRFLDALAKRFGCQGDMLFVMAPSAAFALAIIDTGLRPCAILLDHDMPWGNGLELMAAGAQIDSPTCAISGIDANNERLMANGAVAVAKKGDWDALDRFLERLK